MEESAELRVGNKKPTQKTHPKKNQKKPPKRPTKNVFCGYLSFFKFLIFYENNTNFSL
jgi:hypothetical protein